MLNGKTVFLSGPISADPDYYEKFMGAEEHCCMMGAKEVWNPARLQKGLTYDQYMFINLSAIKMGGCAYTGNTWMQCDIPDILVTLPGYLNSPGSAREVKEAYDRGIQVVKFEELEGQVKI